MAAHSGDPAFPNDPRIRPGEFDPGASLLEFFMAHAMAGVALKCDGHENARFLTAEEVNVTVKNAYAVAKAAVNMARP